MAEEEEEEEEEEDGEYREPGELHEDSVESLQDPLKSEEMKQNTTEMDRFHKEKKRKSSKICSSSTSGSRYASITSTDSKYVQVRLSEDNEDIGKVRVRSSRWGEEVPLCSEEASEPQFDVKNGGRWKKDVFQPSKEYRWSEETSSSPSPLPVNTCAVQKDHDYLTSRASRYSEETSLNVEKSSPFRVKNHTSQQKDDFKASKTSRRSEKTLGIDGKLSSSYVKNQNLQKKDDFQASAEAAPNEEKSLSFHETNHVLQKKDDFRVSKASRWSEETSTRKEKLPSFHTKNQELLKKADFEGSKASRWSEEVSPSEEKLSSSSVKNQDWQEKDDFKASKTSRWSAETSPSEEKVSLSHVKNNILQRKDDFQISKKSRWLEETSPRNKKPSSLQLKNRDLQKKVDFDVSKATRWSKEPSPCEEKSFLFGAKNQDLEKKDSFEVESELSTDDDDDSSEEDDDSDECMKIKSDFRKINGAIESPSSKRKSSPASESQICLRQDKSLDMVRSSPWKEEILQNREISSMFQVKNQGMQGKADSEAKSAHEFDDEQGVKYEHSEADDHMKTSVALGEIGRVNISRDHSVKESGYSKEADLNSCRHSSHEGVHDDNEDGFVSFFPEEIDSADYKIDMLKGCRSVEEFEMVKRINEGTYGVVYKAKDKKTGEIMALKKVKMEKERDGFPMTSLREINILLSIHHPCIVNVKEVVVGNSMDSIYMVMEYMEHDLKRFMGTLEHPFSQSQVKCLMLKLFEGIKHLHDNWVLHRDLKTSNILLNNQGDLKICDFGLARQYGSPLKTYTSLVVTLWYRSPELLLGCKEYSTAVDMWSLGCIMAELLSKEPLFCGKNEVDQIDKIFRTLGTPDETIWPDFSNLPGVKCSFVKQRFNRLREKFPPTAFAGGVTLSNKGFDLLSRLLMYDPKKRITSEDALNHEWFKEFPLPIMPDLSSLKRTGVSTW